MSSTLSVYVGPYLEISGSFVCEPFAAIVMDGRWEAAAIGDPLILIPAKTVPGINREIAWDYYSQLPVASFNGLAMLDEKLAFEVYVDPVIKRCNATGVPWKIRWGVVPCIK